MTSWCASTGENRNMKKYISLLLIVLLAAGCGPVKKVTFAAVLEKQEENKAALVFTDREGTILNARDIEIPADVFFGDEAVFYTADYAVYESVVLEGFKKGDTLKNLTGDLLYHKQGGCTAVFDGEKIVFILPDQTTREYEWQETVYFRSWGDRLYVCGSSCMRVFDLASCEQLAELSVMESGFYGMTEIEGHVYLVTDNGYMDVESGITYVYTRPFDDVVHCRQNVLTVSENDEICFYYVSFDSYGMILTDDFDDEVTMVDFEKMFADYYEKGYEVVYFEQYD